MKLAELVVPESTVVLTQECQKGVIGDLSLLPALAESAVMVSAFGSTPEIEKPPSSALIACLIMVCRSGLTT